MVPILDMVINVDRDRFDDDVAVGVPGQGFNAGLSSASKADRRLP